MCDRAKVELLIAAVIRRRVYRPDVIANPAFALKVFRLRTA